MQEKKRHRDHAGLCIREKMRKNNRKQYLYIMRGLQMHIIPAEDVAWVYGIDQTVTEYTGRGEKHIRKHLYASIHLRNRKAYKLSISRNNFNILIHELQTYPNIRIGY